MRGVRGGRERERQEWFVREGRESECCERVRGVRVGRKSEGLIGARKWTVKEGRESEGCERVWREGKGFERGTRVGCERGRESEGCNKVVV